MVSKQREQLHSRAAVWYVSEYPWYCHPPLPTPHSPLPTPHTPLPHSPIPPFPHSRLCLIRICKWTFTYRYSDQPNAGEYYATILYHYENANNLQESLQYALKAAEYPHTYQALLSELLFFLLFLLCSPVLRSLALSLMRCSKICCFYSRTRGVIDLF